MLRSICFFFVNIIVLHYHKWYNIGDKQIIEGEDVEMLEGLNNGQKKAVEATEGNVRVVACPGSGKTKTLVTRYAYLTEEIGIPEENILCISFTNKATREVKERIKKIKGRNFDSSLITTYHGFCIKALRGNMNFFHFPKNINVLDYEDQKSILGEVYKELGISAKNNNYKTMLGKISSYKSSNVELVVDFLSNPKENEVDEINLGIKDNEFELILKGYLKKQRQTYYIDYDDIVHFTYVLFKRNERVLSQWQEKIQYLMIDEFQDSDKIQIEIALMLTKKSNNLFIVGDDDQSIYSWRGAYPQFFVDFAKETKNCTDIILDTNYRSTKKIVNVSNTLIKNNKVRVGKDMITPNEEGVDIICFHGNTDSDESSWIANKVSELISKGVSLNDIAILYRSNYQSRSVEEGLLKVKVPYTIWGGTKFFERKEIKDVVSYLKLINSDDDIAFKRIINTPKRKMGPKKVEFIENMAQKENISLYEALKNNIDDNTFKSVKIKPFVDIIEHCRENNLSSSQSIRYILEKTGYEEELRSDCDEDRLENLAELVKFTRDFEMSEDVVEGTLEEFLEYIALYTNKDEEDGLEGNIKLLTMHTSKGLEFDYVFIVGLNDSVVPNSRAVFEKGDVGLEEERRLMYVAMTRAKKQLFLTDSGGFSYDGKEKETSRFIFELGDENIEKIGYNVNKNKFNFSNKPSLNKSLMSNETTSFVEGDLVKHKIFGIGKVTNVDYVAKSYIIYFDNERLKDSRVISMKYSGINKV